MLLIPNNTITYTDFNMSLEGENCLWYHEFSVNPDYFPIGM